MVHGDIILSYNMKGKKMLCHSIENEKKKLEKQEDVHEHMHEQNETTRIWRWQ